MVQFHLSGDLFHNKTEGHFVMAKIKGTIQKCLTKWNTMAFDPRHTNSISPIQEKFRSKSKFGRESDVLLCKNIKDVDTLFGKNLFKTPK